MLAELQAKLLQDMGATQLKQLMIESHQEMVPTVCKNTKEEMAQLKKATIFFLGSDILLVEVGSTTEKEVQTHIVQT